MDSILLKISVIIPVHNAAGFLEKAVSSALEQPEAEEILLIEDGSTDGSLRICEGLAATHGERVRLFRHPGGANLGAAASRNRGIAEASCDWIAFLDADDYYLPRRFARVREAVAAHPDAEGVYEATGAAFYDEEGKVRFMNTKAAGHSGDPTSFLTTIRETLPPERLFRRYLSGEVGYVHLNALTICRSLALRVGGFNPVFPLAEDTLFLEKVMFAGRLYPGSIDRAVAVRGVHRGNRATQDGERVRLFALREKKELFLWLLEQDAPPWALRRLLFRYLKGRYAEAYLGGSRLRRAWLVARAAVELGENFLNRKTE